MKLLPVIAAIVLPLIVSLPAQAQPRYQRITIETAIDAALKNNLLFNINQSEINRAGLAVKTANNIPKTGVFAENEDLRPGDTKGILKIGLSQSIAWPGLYKARREYFNQQLKYYQLNTSALQAVIKKDVRTAYYELWYLQNRLLLFERLDSIYSALFNAAALRVKTGEAAGLEKISAETKMKEVQAMLLQNRQQLLVQQQQLMMLLNMNVLLLPPDKPVEQINFSITDTSSLHPGLALQQQHIAIASSNIAVQKNDNKPEFSGRFFSQRLWGASDPFTGFSVTAAFPLFGTGAYKNKIRAAQAGMEVEQKQLAYQTQQFITLRQQALTEIEKHRALLQFYESAGLKQAEEIIKAAALSYTSGEISFAELSQFLSQAIDTQKNYLEVLNQYNQSVIRFIYYNND